MVDEKQNPTGPFRALREKQEKANAEAKARKAAQDAQKAAQKAAQTPPAATDQVKP